jgi:VIT1/CCC1 family predicted Fe2+/Mn2+ transporter
LLEVMTVASVWMGVGMTDTLGTGAVTAHRSSGQEPSTKVGRGPCDRPGFGPCRQLRPPALPIIDPARQGWRPFSNQIGACAVERFDPLVEVTLARSSGGRYRRRLAQEQRAAAVYRALAAKRSGQDREILLALARAEDRHAAHWAAKLRPAQRPGSEPGRRSRLLGWLARRLGSLVVLGLVQRAEAGGHYDADAEATAAMAADERVHALVVSGLAQQQRARASGWFRAAVFGANDGLVSNFSLVAGMAGAGSSSTVILLAGLAGLLAGALSMAAGEYVSVRSQRELLEAAAHELDPATLAALRDHEASELALVFRARGSSPEQAEQQAAALLGEDDAEAAATEVEAGEDVVGSAGAAAGSSFVAFASGAVIPILPFFLSSGRTAIVMSAVLVGVALFATGATVGVLTGGPLLRRGLRQLAIGAGAAVATYALGRVFGATLG